MTLREKLIVSRNKAGLSQMELAERLGVSRQAVSRWESGDTTPTMDKLKSLARIYGVSLDWLCSDAADRELPEAAKPEADSTQIEDMEHEEIDIPDQDESGFDFEWKD